MTHEFDVLTLAANLVQDFETNPTCPNYGNFIICGSDKTITRNNHHIVLSDIHDTGHTLLIRVNYGPTGRFTIENISDPSSNAIFSYKHSGQSKKKFKPGDIISPPETHVLLWETVDKENKPVTVILTIIPLSQKFGLQLHYSLQHK